MVDYKFVKHRCQLDFKENLLTQSHVVELEKVTEDLPKNEREDIFIFMDVTRHN